MNNVYVILGASGSGKSTIMKKIENEGGIKKVITCTSRKIRDGEIEGLDYYFKEKEYFIQNELIAPNEYAGNYYGISVEELKKQLEKGNVYVILEKNGCKEIKKIFPNSKSIFIDIKKEEMENRLKLRNEKPEIIKKRIEQYDEDVKAKQISDFIVENEFGKEKETIKKIKSILNLK